MHPCLPCASCSYASVVRLTEAMATLNAFLVANYAVTIVFVCVLCLVYAFVYRPMITRLDKEMKLVRSLLLLFPDEVICSVPQLMDLAFESQSSSVKDGSR